MYSKLEKCPLIKNETKQKAKNKNKENKRQEFKIHLVFGESLSFLTQLFIACDKTSTKVRE